MIDEYRFPGRLRELILAGLPEDTSLHGGTPELRHTYLPAAHTKALRPDSMLVVGIRGSGKSFWWAALQQKEHRALIGRQVGIAGSTTTSTGFGERSSPDDYPGKDVLSALVRKFDSRRIWQTVVLKHVARERLAPAFSSAKTWGDRVEWAQGHPEQVERVLSQVDAELHGRDEYHLVLFDALDRTADDWATMDALVRGLLQVLLDFRSYKRIRLKVFVRPDQIEHPSVTAFPDSSKVLTQRTELDWPRNELYGLFWQYVANEPADGALFRDGCAKVLSVGWSVREGIWSVPETLRNEEEIQRAVFHAMTGEWMGRDRRRGLPYTWLPNHLGDARRQVSPRSFLAALRRAAGERPRPKQDYALHYESIKAGVQAASAIRVREMQEDYPWVRSLLQPLLGISVPCAFEEIETIWRQGKVLDKLGEIIATADVRLPPAHLADGSRGVLTDLTDLGLVEPVSEGRVNLPDVYPVGYGMGRRGGVKPVAR